MSDLVSRVLAAIEAREAKAQALLDRLVWDDVADSIGRDWANWMPEDRGKVLVYLDDNDPAAVLRRCEAYREAINRCNMLRERQRRFDDTTAVGERRIVHTRITEAEGMLEFIAHGLGIPVEEETTQ